MRVTNIRRGLVALAVFALLTTGCSVNDQGELNVSDDLTGDLSDFSCDKVEDTRETVQDYLDSPEGSNERSMLQDFNLTPANEDQVKDTLRKLDERIEVCDNEAAEASESPSPSPSESPSEPTDTSSPSEDESTDNDPDPADFVGWDDVVEDTPEGLEQSIEDTTSETGFDWDDVETWAEARMPDGNPVDARAVIVFGRPGLTDKAVRESFGLEVIDDDDEDEDELVPVVRAKRCYTDVTSDEQVCPSGDERLRVILAPVDMADDKVVGLRYKTGVLLTDGFSLVTYDPR